MNWYSRIKTSEFKIVSRSYCDIKDTMIVELYVLIEFLNDSKSGSHTFDETYRKVFNEHIVPSKDTIFNGYDVQLSEAVNKIIPLTHKNSYINITYNSKNNNILTNNGMWDAYHGYMAVNVHFKDNKERNLFKLVYGNTTVNAIIPTSF